MSEQEPLTETELDAIDAWWRAANYLSVGQIYLLANPLLTEPLRPEHVKPRLLGHWGTTPGLNLIYAHLNRVIRNQDLNAIYVCGPGHGGPGMVANSYLEGTYSELYPGVTQDAAGLARLVKQFSFPGGIPSHDAPETPGSIHEGGELGYALVHAYGAAFDNPDLIVACVVGDGEAETGPLAGSWHSNKFLLNPVTYGAVLPDPAPERLQDRQPDRAGPDPGHRTRIAAARLRVPGVHRGGRRPQAGAPAVATMDAAVTEIRTIQRRARGEGDLGPQARPAWPAIVLRTPKGWTGPKVVDGLPVEGTWRAHQVPIAAARENPEHLAQLEAWLRSYHAEELFDPSGALRPELAALAPRGDRRMSANPNGGRAAPRAAAARLRRLPGGGPCAGRYDVRGHPGARGLAARRDQGQPGELPAVRPGREPNRLGDIYEVTNNVFEGQIVPGDNHLAQAGRVMEVLSEHMCQGGSRATC